MPELPEVETVKRGLNKLVIGKKIISVSHDWPGPKTQDVSRTSGAASAHNRQVSSLGEASASTPSENWPLVSPKSTSGAHETPWVSSKAFPNSQEDVDGFMIGATIERVDRRGKAILISLNTGFSLVIHLKMTGQVVYVGEVRYGAGHPNDSLVDGLPDRSTRVEITFSDKTKMFFNDQRKFGYMKLLPSEEVQNLPFFQKLGPEPLVDSFTASDFIERIKKRKGTTVKAAILDQSTLAGVGNIYADEALFGAQIHPARRVHELKNVQLEELLKQIKSVMSLSIEKGGSTDKNYVNAEGERGSYLEFAQVFKRQGQSCLVDGTTIIKSRVAGRGTHYCPTCQTPPRGFK